MGRGSRGDQRSRGDVLPQSPLAWSVGRGSQGLLCGALQGEAGSEPRLCWPPLCMQTSRRSTSRALSACIDCCTPLDCAHVLSPGSVHSCAEIKKVDECGCGK